MEKAVLILDFGTSNVRAMLIAVADGRIAAKSSRKNQWLSGENGQSEMDVLKLWETAQSCVEDIIGKDKEQTDILGIGFSFFGDSLLPVDKEGNPLCNMLMAFDTRAQEEAAYLEQTIGKEKFREITGYRCLSMLCCSKILWLKKNRPEVFKKAAFFLNIQEFIFLKMGLGIKTDYTLAGRKTMMDIHKRKWSFELIQHTGTNVSQMGETVGESTEVAGYISSFGRVKLPGKLPVIYGAHDCECGLLGLGVSPENKNIAANVAGTYEVLSTFSKNDIANISGIAELGLGLGKNDMILNGSSIAGSYIKWFQKEMSDDPEKMFGNMEKQVEYDGEGSLFFLMDNDIEKCILDGLTVRTTRSEIYQAMIEGITFKLRELQEELEKAKNSHFTHIMAGGGGSASDKWLQLKADLLQKEVRRVENMEVSAVGAAIITAVGIGYYESYEKAIEAMVKTERVFIPDSEVSQKYLKKFQMYKEKVKMLKENL